MTIRVDDEVWAEVFAAANRYDGVGGVARHPAGRSAVMVIVIAYAARRPGYWR